MCCQGVRKADYCYERDESDGEVHNCEKAIDDFEIGLKGFLDILFEEKERSFLERSN